MNAFRDALHRIRNDLLSIPNHCESKFTMIGLVDALQDSLDKKIKPPKEVLDILIDLITYLPDEIPVLRDSLLSSTEALKRQLSLQVVTTKLTPDSIALFLTTCTTLSVKREGEPA